MEFADNSGTADPTTVYVVLPGVGTVPRGALGYPARLEGAQRPPAAIWYRGRLPRDGERALAIVGSRAATGAGRDRARAIAVGLGRRGFAVVSGGAFGIDAAAHEGAMDAGGATFAVLGCGVDVVYPDRHGPLFARIAEAGGLLSELPPGTAPRPAQFPARNRLVAALADAVIVVEAALRSGARITARIAAARGQVLLAVPGSAGTDALLASGAALPIESAAEVEPALAGEVSRRPPAPPPLHLAPLVAALRERADTPAGIAQRLGLPIGPVLGLLVEAELDGWARRGAGSRYEVARGH